MLTVEVDGSVGDRVVRKLTDADLGPVKHLAVKWTSGNRLAQVQHLDHVLTCRACAQNVHVYSHRMLTNYQQQTNSKPATRISKKRCTNIR